MAPSPEALGRVLQVQGDLDHLRYLQNQGSLVFVPTHSSNLDSIVLAQALEISGLPPVIYGAGKNLFTNPIISFFMHNLGAYRVDRRIKSALYKELLKTWSCVMIERGYHSLFFPGGTRSRSGLIENHLKLGLVGSAVEAFSQNSVRGVARRVFFVPTTINYALVLEAESLVEDWLAEEGGARYIIEDDEFSRLDRWVAFFRKLSGQDAACVIRFGEPLDPFGNQVDDEGCSVAPGGQSIDPVSYTLRDDKPVLDDRRDAAYTRELGELLVERYRSETVVMSTQLVAHVLYRQLVASTPGLGIFARLRLRGEVSVPREELVRQLGEAREALRALAKKGKIQLSRTVSDATPDELLNRALSVWSGYHSRVAARDLGVEITAEDPTLLLYYQNRLVSFAEAIAPPELQEAAREIGQIGVKGGLR
jgi:glycerol-3-phosphate O-acyltransferase